MPTVPTFTRICQHAKATAVILLGIALILAWQRYAPLTLVHAQEQPGGDIQVDAKVVIERGAGQQPAATTRPPATQWLDRVAEFFREPIVYVALITLGLIGIFFEFKLPGTTLPGAVAAVCFVLFFWAHSFTGQFVPLAILLFLLGLIFLGIEVFLVPGLGFSGVLGVVLIFISMLLVTLEYWPTTENEWLGVGSTLGNFAIGAVLAIAGATTLAWYLPHIPVLNRMVLAPPEDDAPQGSPAELHTGEAAQLIGAIGVAVTPLRPSGKAQFADRFLDVIADGDFVLPGSRVQVIEIESMRIVVREV